MYWGKNGHSEGFGIENRNPLADIEAGSDITRLECVLRILMKHVSVR